ncbi:hypothetical protein [Hymenobacter metallicola]|uniref:Uncharacterized protein n=1 Tax=Hymenobacter metallicola TaxID=2563114 RepID=A0A4Z0QIG8_9BACT|nr:hypothetical protein [Hymenobacter metallicola]TGE28482.1 hypothetical protein E5K02_03165 [Hymenobacter metallicola]
MEDIAPGRGVQYLNWTISALLLLTNLLFLTELFQTVRSSGGPMGYGLLVSPFLLLSLATLLPAALTLTLRGRHSKALLLLNLLGLLWNCGWTFLLLTTPRMD